MKPPHKYRCSACGEKAGVDIVYGEPDYELREAELRGELVLGGCCIMSESPDRQCAVCGHYWKIKRRGLDHPEIKPLSDEAMP